MKRHTPGPWVNAGAVGYGRLIDPNIAVVYGRNVTVEAEANSRLIAAAPELLEALLKIAACFREGDICRSPHADPGVRAALEAVDAAIAKATGEATP